MSEIEDRVRSLAEPVLLRHGAALVDVEVKRGRTQLVRVIADRSGGIDLETCAKVSSELSRMLDVEDPIDGTYTLEVTSPGLDRPLSSAGDFRRNVGRRVRVVLERAQYEGEVLEVRDDAVVLAGVAEAVPFEVIKKAKLILPW